MTAAGRGAVLGIGSLVRHDGGVFAVVEMTGRRLLLRRNGTQELRQVDVGWLLSHPTTSLAGGDTPAESAAGITLATLGGAQDAGLSERVGHLQELLTGYRSGSAELALPGEPRAAYAAGVPLMARYAAKAAELGVGVSTVRRWVARFTADGPAGLLPSDTGRGGGPLGRADPRWLDTARAVLAGHVNASRPTRAIVLAEIEQRLVEEHGPDVVPLPARSTAYGLLRELGRGTNAFTGSAKAKRSIASRPQGVYGRLRATRPGEYVLLDTTRLDVFAMEPVTCRWVQVELTAAMDVYSRCICGLRLTPVSTKAADVAGCLYDTVRPRPRPGEAAGELPYHGLPATVVVDARKLIDAAGRALLPSVAAETIVYDHGQIYLSNHVRSVCARLGISMQPARPRTPTDKSPLERWFRTLADGLLVALPGYKGADVHSRGLDVEDHAFFFLDELEAVIREWIELCYHRRAHRGLTVPEIPGLAMSPLDMFEHGVHRAGYLTVPDRPELAYDFLQPQWATIQHYGVEIHTLRYNGPALVRYRNTTSPFTGVHAGRWPFDGVGFCNLGREPAALMTAGYAAALASSDTHQHRRSDRAAGTTCAFPRLVHAWVRDEWFDAGSSHLIDRPLFGNPAGHSVPLVAAGLTASLAATNGRQPWRCNVATRDTARLPRRTRIFIRFKRLHTCRAHRRRSFLLRDSLQGSPYLEAEGMLSAFPAPANARIASQQRWLLFLARPSLRWSPPRRRWAWGPCDGPGSMRRPPASRLGWPTWMRQPRLRSSHSICRCGSERSSRITFDENGLQPALTD